MTRRASVTVVPTVPKDLNCNLDQWTVDIKDQRLLRNFGQQFQFSSAVLFVQKNLILLRLIVPLQCIKERCK